MSIQTHSHHLRDLTGLARALADPTRVRALNALQENELCVCQLVELLGLSPSNVSRHLGILAQSSLVDSRKEGRWVYYRRAGADAAPAVQKALRWVDEAIAESPEAHADREKLQSILAQPIQKLCRTRQPRE